MRKEGNFLYLSNHFSSILRISCSVNSVLVAAFVFLSVACTWGPRTTANARTEHLVLTATETRLKRNTKDYRVHGATEGLSSREMYIQLERADDRYVDAPDTMVLLPLTAQIYVDEVLSISDEIVIDWRLDPRFSVTTKLQGVLSCSRVLMRRTFSF